MSKKAFNGNLWRHNRQDIITGQDALQRVIQGFQSDGLFNFGSGEIAPDVLLLVACGLRKDVTGLILECGKIRTGASSLIIPYRFPG